MQLCNVIYCAVLHIWIGFGPLSFWKHARHHIRPVMPLTVSLISGKAGSSDICWTFVGQPWQFGHPNIGDSGYLRMIWCALQERGKVIPCWFTTTVVLWLFWAGRGYLSNYQVIWSPPKGNHTRRIHKVWTCAYFPAVFWSELILIVILIHFVLSFLRWDIYSSG